MPDRAKALLGVLIVHLGLAAAMLTGLNVRSVQKTVEALKIFDVRQPPPVLRPPPPTTQSARAADEQGAAGRKAVATAIVAPKPRIILPRRSPVIAATRASTGNAATSGAANAGDGPGAGGSGNGFGGGGTGGGGGGAAVPARWLSGGISDRDNRFGRFAGVVEVRFTVAPDGFARQCRVARSSGDGELDTLTCRLLVRRLRFAPARDAQGRPVPAEVGTTYTWGVYPRRF